MARNKHKGAQNELQACAWLLSQGYEVFRAVSAHGSVDRIALGVDDVERATRALSGIVGKRLTYQTSREARLV